MIQIRPCIEDERQPIAIDGLCSSKYRMQCLARRMDGMLWKMPQNASRLQRQEMRTNIHKSLDIINDRMNTVSSTIFQNSTTHSSFSAVEERNRIENENDNDDILSKQQEKQKEFTQSYQKEQATVYLANNIVLNDVFLSDFIKSSCALLQEQTEEDDEENTPRVYYLQELSEDIFYEVISFLNFYQKEPYPNIRPPNPPKREDYIDFIGEKYYYTYVNSYSLEKAILLCHASIYLQCDILNTFISSVLAYLVGGYTLEELSQKFQLTFESLTAEQRELIEQNQKYAY